MLQRIAIKMSTVPNNIKLRQFNILVRFHKTTMTKEDCASSCLVLCISTSSHLETLTMKWVLKGCQKLSTLM